MINGGMIFLTLYCLFIPGICYFLAYLAGDRENGVKVFKEYIKMCISIVAFSFALSFIASGVK